MSARRIVLWRHGQTDANFSGMVQGSSDTPLNRTGRAQAAAAARELAQIGAAALVASDLSRAWATAGALADLTGLTPLADPRLRERGFGQWEGLTMEEVSRRWPEETARWARGDDVPEVGMETRAAAAERFDAAVTEAAQTVDDDGTVVVASHGGVIVAGLTRLLGLDPSGWRGLRVMGNAHWAVIERTRVGAPAWRIASYDLGVSASDNGEPGGGPLSPSRLP
ncbi:MAG: histidine phosphatase family protein [Bifidobacteriaceae bacterium]|nr:histidine phosphatase family protein [Bifidobacteriaceae bacterium]